MHNLTDRDIKVSEVPFTTYKPEVGIFVYNDVPIHMMVGWLA
jgi:ribosome-interacting GTPase 1